MASWEDQMKAAYAEYGWQPDAQGADFWSGNQNLDLLKSTLASDAARVGASRVSAPVATPTSSYSAPANVDQTVADLYKNTWGAAGDKAGVDWWTNYAKTSGDAGWQDTLSKMLKESSSAKSVSDLKYAQNLIGFNGSSFDANSLSSDARNKIILDGYERFGGLRPGEDDYATWVNKFGDIFGTDFSLEDDWANTWANPEGRTNYMKLKSDQDKFDLLEELAAMGFGKPTGGGGGGAGGGSVADYMNPFLDAVLAPAVRQLTDATQTRRNQLGSSAFASGAYGDARHGVESAQLTEDAIQQLSDLTGRLYGQGYDTAMNWKNVDLDRQMMAAFQNAGLENQWFNNQLGAVGTGSGIYNNAANLGFSYADLLTGLDSYDRDWTQQQINADYDDWWAEQNWGDNRLSNFLNIINGVPGQTSSSTSTPSNMWASILGSLASNPKLTSGLFGKTK